MDALASLLVDPGYVVLDGGLSTELERNGADLGGDLWTARLLIDEPDRIRSAHAAFFAAGARVATTASYQASFEGFAARGIDGDQTWELLRRSVDLARGARDAHGSGLVAASVGPYGAMLADGSEYTGDYPVGARELRGFHARRLEVLAGSGADLLAIETIPSVVEASALADLLGPGTYGPAWMSFSCRDGTTLNDGTPFEEAVDLAAAASAVAIGANCTAPQHFSSLIRIARARTDRPIVVYPNRGARWDAARRAWSHEASTESFATMAAGWRAEGATFIGACCGSGAIEIEAIASGLARV